LPDNCWIRNYYQPLEKGFEDFLERNGHDPLAMQLIEAEKQEINLYRKFKDYYGYVFYVARLM
jgi:hypothetical protein